MAPVAVNAATGSAAVGGWAAVGPVTGDAAFLEAASPDRLSHQQGTAEARRR
jgi:hypothetical protein